MSTPVLPGTAVHLLARVARAQRDGRLPSLVAGVVRDGGLAWSAGRGAVPGDPVDVQYRLGSISKTVTAVAVLRLRDEGRLALDDVLDRHLPGTPFGSSTVGQLLAHAGGLRAESPTDWWERTPGLAWPALAARLTPEDRPHAPGRFFHYSNLGYAVLGEVVARLRRRPWLDVVTDEVLQPLGMTRTSGRPLPPAQQGWAVHPWADLVQPEPEHDALAMAPAGQLWSTLADLARFGAFLAGDGGDVLPAATLEEMAVPHDLDDDAPEGTAYGLGLTVDRTAGRTLVGHGGSMPGFLAGVLVERATGLGAVGLANGTTGWTADLLPDLIDAVRGAEPPAGPVWTPLTTAPDADTLALVGLWYWGPQPYRVTLSGDGLLDLEGVLRRARPSRFRPRGDGTWLGLDGYHAGEVLRVVPGDPPSLDLGSFVLSREPYGAGAPHPGGVSPDGWRPLPVAP